MTMTIWSGRNSVVVLPGEAGRFDLQVYGADGAPAAAVPLNASVDPPDAGVTVKVTPTDAAGAAQLSVRAGNHPARVGLRVAAGDAVWTGTLYVTAVHVDLHGDVRLAPDDEALLRMLFWDKDEVRVLREFGAGQSGSRVFQVQAIDRGRANITQVVKIGPQDSLRHEEDNYQLLKDRLPWAATVGNFTACGAAGAVIYGDAGAASSLAPVVPLAVYFAERSNEDLAAALYAILETGLGGVYRYHEVRPLTFRSLVGKFLPENLVVSLDGCRPPHGVHRSGGQLSIGQDCKRLSARQIERMDFSLTPGDLVLIENLPISKLQNDNLNLADSGQTRYKAKVRFDGPPPEGVSTGDRVDVCARFVTDRRQRMQFAVEHCLGQFGGEFGTGRWQLEGESYPDPHPLLQTVLDTPCAIAWGTIHGDLHWENLMLESSENWWLIDYGLTGKGPILFDFVKLELYLRYTELARLKDLTAKEILEFERALVDDPLGNLSVPVPSHPALCKAADAIRQIRRLARRYMVGGLFDYWRLLFGYAMALTKYYPTQDQWDAAEAPRDRLEKSARPMLHALAVALSVGRLLAWDQWCGKRPTMKFRFVGLGKPLTPQPGVVALDVGSTCQPGVIDHHFAAAGDRDLECATSMVWKRPDLVTDHLAGIAPGDVTWTLHEHPDFDCIASAYLAWHLVTLGFFPPGTAQLAAYARQVDAGAEFLDQLASPERTPYALFQLHLHEVESLGLPAPQANEWRMKHGFAVLDYLCRLEAEGRHALQENRVPHEHGFWGALGRDRGQFEEHDFDRHKTFQARILRGTASAEVDGLVIDSPRSLLFKTWARRAGYPLLVVRWPQPDKPDHRMVISVPPSMRGALCGLGRALEEAETKKRGEAKRRPPPPRSPDVDNADPWYDGRSPLHAYTIVDSPREGTVLTVAEVVKIVRGRKWQKLQPGRGSPLSA